MNISDRKLREEIQEVVAIMSKGVKSTMGPNGANVGLLSPINKPIVVNDGVTVCKGFKFDEPLKDYIAEVYKTASKSAEDQGGDGTTGCIAIAEHIIREGLNLISANFSRVDLIRGIKKATIEVISELDNYKIEVSGDILKQIATISANNDSDLGSVIAQTIETIGYDGIIDYDYTDKGKTYVEVVEGMQYHCSYTDKFFSNAANMTEVFYKNPYVLLIDYKITSVQDYIEVLQYVHKEDRPIVIVANDFTEQVRQETINIFRTHKIKVCLVVAPGYGDEIEENYQDLLDTTGATYISRKNGIEVTDILVKHLGELSTVRITEDHMIITKEGLDLSEKIEALKKDPKNKDRVARLSQGVAKIYVYGRTPIEASETNYRIEDAINATKAAMAEGVIAGGGFTLLQISDKMNCQLDCLAEKLGYEIVKNAILEPIKTIVFNSGKEPMTIVEKVRATGKGYNARTDSYGDLMEMGVIDPVKVIKSSLTAASSVAQVFIGMNTVIYSEK